MRRIVVTVAALGLALGSSVAAPARAQRVQAPRVLLVAPQEPELLARIEGQTRDLPLALETATREPGLDSTRARALARQRGSAAVVWLLPRADGGFDVHVLDALRDSERTRAVPPQPEGEQLGSSAVFEAAALVVRGELSSLLEEEDLAGRAARAQGASAGSDGTAPDGGGGAARPTPGDGSTGVPDEPEPPGPPPRDAFAHAGAWSLRAAGRAALIARDRVAFGPLLGLGYDAGRFAFGLQATTALPVELERDGVAVTLRRHGIALSAQLVGFEAGSLRMLAGVEAGAVLYARDTEIRSGALLPAPSRTKLSAAFGANTELQWLPSPTIGLALGFGLEALTAPTQLVLQRPGTRELVRRLSWYEPWVSLALVFRFGPAREQAAQKQPGE